MDYHKKLFYLISNLLKNNDNDEEETFMNLGERKAVFSLSLIFAFRMLGLFLILPVFTTYGEQLSYSTPTLIGLALGIYGLTQAILQIPFGLLSDKFGRKPMILLGLVLFAVGSVIAATSSSIHGIIIGRAIQGAGAVGSVIIALVADLTSEENRTKAMAVIGLTIGFAFTLSMILGPVLAAIMGISGIFWLTAALAIIGIIFLFVTVPTPQTIIIHRDAETIPSLLKSILINKDLLRLDFGILILHAVLTASFIVLPLYLTQFTGLNLRHQWIIYLPVLILSFIAMLPMIIIAEKFRKMRLMFLLGIGLIIVAELGLGIFPDNAITMGTLLFIFFTAFTFLEASLPSLISKQSPAGSKGTAMGIYSTAQFMGIFLGGIYGGWLLEHFNATAIFFGNAIVCIAWYVIAYTMAEPNYLATRSVKLNPLDHTDSTIVTEQLKQIPGIADVLIIAEEGIAYLKVDTKKLDQEALTKFIENVAKN